MSIVIKISQTLCAVPLGEINTNKWILMVFRLLPWGNVCFWWLTSNTLVEVIFCMWIWITGLNDKFVQNLAGFDLKSSTSVAYRLLMTLISCYFPCRSIMASLGADVISGYLVELQSDNRNVDEVRGLTTRLKALQYKLQRLWNPNRWRLRPAWLWS